MREQRVSWSEQSALYYNSVWSTTYLSLFLGLPLNKSPGTGEEISVYDPRPIKESIVNWFMLKPKNKYQKHDTYAICSFWLNFGFFFRNNIVFEKSLIFVFSLVWILHILIVFLSLLKRAPNISH